MPTYPIQLKRNGTAAATPSSLLHGEVALNYADGKLFWKDASNVIQSFTFQAYALSSHTHAASDITSGTLDAARLPLATTVAAGAVIVGTGLGVSSGTVSVTYGTSAGTACQGNDSRLSDTRTPTDGSVTTAKIANDAVTYAKIQNVSATDRLLGRSSAGSGDVEEIACGSFGRSLIGSADAAAARNTLSVQPTASPAFTGAATFDNTGNVVPLTVTNTGTANSFVVNDESGDTTPFVVDAAGRVVIGATSAFSDAHKFAILGGLPSSSGVTVGFIVRSAIPSSTTVSHVSYASNVWTDAASFTLGGIEHFAALQQAFGAGSSVTNQYGFSARSSLTGATNNYGFYSDIASGTGRWNFYANGTAASYFGGQVQISAGSGSAGSYKPGVAVSGDDDTGLQQVGGANTISLVTAGSERVRVDASGKVGIGVTTNLTAALNFPQADSGEVINYFPSETEGVRSGVGKYSAEVRHYVPAGDFFAWRTGGPSGTERMKLSASLLTVGSSVSITASQVYSDTVGATNRDLFIDNAGKLGYVSSIRASKTNIAAIDDVSWLRDLTPVSFHYRRRNEDGTYSDEPDGTLDYGLIAEEVEPVAPEMCFYDVVDGEPQLRGVHYSKLITPMLRYIQQLEARIAALEERNHA